MKASSIAKFLVTVLVTFIFTSCSGGGGGSDSGGGDGLRNNTCGDIGLSSRAAKIINGTVCSNLTSSAVVRIFNLDATNEPTSLCTGTMINATTVLTAAHCFPSQPSGIAIVAGDDSNPIIIAASSYSIHPRYRPTNDALFNDVAIVKTSQAVPVPTLPLLSSASVQGGDKVSIYGFGTDNSSDDLGKDLRSGEMRITSVTADIIRADFDGNGSNTCFGDSGGPMIFNTANGPAIAGLTSSGTQESCSSGDQSLFTNIQSSEVLNFIRQKAGGIAFR